MGRFQGFSVLLRLGGPRDGRFARLGRGVGSLKWLPYGPGARAEVVWWQPAGLALVAAWRKALSLQNPG